MIVSGAFDWYATREWKLIRALFIGEITRREFSDEKRFALAIYELTK